MAATHRNSPLDYAISTASIGFMSIPNFWMGMMMVYFLGWKLGIFPVQGYHSIAKYGLMEAVWYVAMPSLMLGLSHVAGLARQTRSYMLDVLNEDYIRTARAKGLSVFKIRYKHALKNTLMPVVTTLGMRFATMLGGSMITEKIFGLPGIGNEILKAISMKDTPIILGSTIFLGALFMIIMLLVDIIYSFIDPRTKAQFK